VTQPTGTEDRQAGRQPGEMQRGKRGERGERSEPAGRAAHSESADHTGRRERRESWLQAIEHFCQFHFAPQATGTQTLKHLPGAQACSAQVGLIFNAMFAAYLGYNWIEMLFSFYTRSAAGAPFWLLLLAVVPCGVWLWLAHVAMQDARQRVRPTALHILDVTPLIRLLLDDDLLLTMPLWGRRRQRAPATRTTLPGFKIRVELLLREFRRCERWLKQQHGCRFETVEQALSAPFALRGAMSDATANIVIALLLRAIILMAFTLNSPQWGLPLSALIAVLAFAAGLGRARTAGLRLGVADALAEYLLREPPAAPEA